MGAPWPFIVFARGEGKTANRVGLFLAAPRTRLCRATFICGPYKYSFARTDARSGTDPDSLLCLFRSGGTKSRHGTRWSTDLWPLFTARRDHHGTNASDSQPPSRSFNSAAVDWGTSPLWSIWRGKRRHRSLQPVFCGTYRRDVTTPRKCSLLFGLFQYQSGPDGKGVRAADIPISKGERNGRHVKNI